jgi:hypothetical protein
MALEVLSANILDMIQKAHNRGLRNILSVAHTTSIADMHALLNIPPAEYRNKNLFAKFQSRPTRMRESKNECQPPVIMQLLKKQAIMPQIQDSCLGNS